MRRLGSVLALALAAVAGAVALSTSSSLASSGLSWSAPAALPGCGSEPHVVFPYSYPNARSGEGGIIWLGGCGSNTLELAPLGGDDEPSLPRQLTRAGAAAVPLSGPLATLGTTRGQLVAVAAGDGQAMLGEGFAARGIDTLRSLGGSDSLVATQIGFIGDDDVATVSSTADGYAIELRAQRHFQHRFGHALTLDVGRVAPTALSIGMDFRADRLVVWDQAGELYAQYVTNDGQVSPRQAVGPAGYAPQISTVLSDDDRAFVLWTDEPAPGSAGTARVLLAHSAVGPRFHGTETLAAFSEPPTLRLSAGAVAAERLSSEGVALLWPAMSASGDLVVDASGATLHGIVPPSLIALPGQDVRLGAVATGPDNEIVALVEVAPRTSSGFDTQRQALYAIRSNVVHDPGGLGFGTLTQLTAPGPNSDPSVAVDPGSDTAVAAWQTTLFGTRSIEWSVGSGT
ncbi:MAG: hypothetical protein ABSC56_06365 [Solirubrobacteraceae bacterium]